MDFGRGWAGIALVAAAGALLLTGCGGGDDDSGGSASFTGSGYPNVDLANTRSVKGPISTKSVKDLELAWTLQIEGEGAFGSYASSPIAGEGVIYSQDLGSNVQAIDQESGDVLWQKSYTAPSAGPNGLVVQDGSVYGTTPTEVFALDQKSGKQLWTTELTTNPTEGIDLAPGYHEGIVYASTVPVNAGSMYEGGGAGILWALNGKTGKKEWTWDTVPKGLWGNPKVNSGGGVWYTPAFDGKGAMYFGVGNPAPFPGSPQDPWGSSRPGPNLYTNSIVKMNAKTGKMQWYFQLTPHDVYDWDLQGPPMLVEAGGRELVLAAGKSGFVIALDPKNGKLVWKRPVGKHNGHDEDGLIAMRGEYDKLQAPFTVYPGALGGVIAPMSTDGETVFAPVVNLSATMGSGSEKTGEGSGQTNGEIVALDVATGKVKWTYAFPGAPAYGSTTVVNDLVFVTTFDGKVSAFDTSSGRLAWEEMLPTGTNAGVTIEGDTVIAAAGVPQAEGQTAQLVAYRLGG